jgi:hypothetical protein
VIRQEQTLSAYPTSTATISRDAIMVSLLLAALSMVRVICVFLYGINSDEPQHLHVAWGWAQGLRPYRDVFDNHLPLFHIVTAPLFLFASESPQLLTIARVAMLPLGFATIALTALLGWRVAGSKGAIWSAVLASACPPLVLKTLEFRNDTLWCVLVLAAIALVVAPSSRRRSFLIGLLAGLALLTSVKTVVIGLAVLLAICIDRSRHGARLQREELLRFTLATAGALLPIAIAVMWFARAGLLADFLYAAFGYNMSVTVEPGRRIAGAIAFPLLLVLIWRRAYLLDHRSRAFRIIALSIVCFIVVLLCAWPVITTRDFLPMLPLLAVIVAAVCGETLPLIAIAGMIAMVFYGHLWHPPPPAPRQQIADVLRLTSPSDCVMDRKGETVFRRRPTKLMLEIVGRDLLRRGVVADTIANDMIRTGTCVATSDLGELPSGAARFIDANFVNAGSVRVCGRELPHVAPGKEVTFQIAIAERYALRSRMALDGVVLDGKPFTHPRWLAAGSHTLRAPQEIDGATIILAKAADL